MMTEERLKESEAIEKMIEVSSHPSLANFWFCKHIGKKIEDVAETDRGYLEWLRGKRKRLF